MKVLALLVILACPVMAQSPWEWLQVKHTGTSSYLMRRTDMFRTVVNGDTVMVVKTYGQPNDTLMVVGGKVQWSR